MMVMRKILSILGVSLIALSAISQEVVDSSNLIKIGQTMPSFTVTKMDGETLNSAELAGKVVLINFFATWCPPCRAELPFVQKDIYNKYKDNDDFVLMIISREEKPEKVIPYVKEKEYPMTFYSDIDRSCYKQFALQFIPRNYLFDKNGKLVYQSKGFTEPEFKHLLSAIESLVN